MAAHYSVTDSSNALVVSMSGSLAFNISAAAFNLCDGFLDSLTTPKFQPHHNFSALLVEAERFAVHWVANFYGSADSLQ